MLAVVMVTYSESILNMHRGMTNTMTVTSSGLLTMFLVFLLIISPCSAWPIGKTAHIAPSTPMDASESAFGDVIQPTVRYPAGETGKTSSMDAYISPLGDVIHPTDLDLAGETEKTSSMDAFESALGDVIQPTDLDLAGESEKTSSMDASKSAFGDVIQPTDLDLAGETEKTSSMDASKSALGDVIQPTVWSPAGETSSEPLRSYRVSPMVTEDRFVQSPANGLRKTQEEESSEDPGILKVDISWKQLEALLRSLQVRHYRENVKKFKNFRSPMFIGK